MTLRFLQLTERGTLLRTTKHGLETFVQEATACSEEFSHFRNYFHAEDWKQQCEPNIGLAEVCRATRNFNSRRVSRTPKMY